MEEVKCLTSEQYYKFRALANDIIIAKMKQDAEAAKRDFLAKDIEIMKLKHLIMGHQVKQMNDGIKSVENCYSDYKRELEEMLQMSLNDCVIDDFTYQVKKLQE
jgi:hypothetical protein